jgi:hypothetical protein
MVVVKGSLLGDVTQVPLGVSLLRVTKPGKKIKSQMI